MATAKDKLILEQEEFCERTLDACQTHDEWLTAIRCLLLFLLENDALLVNFIGREANREIERNADSATQAEMMQGIFEELGLKLTMARRYL